MLSGLAALAALGAAPASAQEFALFGGMLEGGGDHTYSWAIDYQEGLSEHTALGFTWYNEGHIPNHHRDGQAVQFWGRWPLEHRRFVLSAGAGPYRYFDTTAATNGSGYSNSHGWGVLMSVRAAYYTSSRWVTQLQLNRTQIFSGPNTTSLMFGVGYQLDAPDTPGPRDTPQPRTGKVTQNELTAMLGETILNSRSSPSALGGSLEYRRGLLRHVDWTATWMYEGSKQSIRRNGVASQLWLTRAFLDDKVTLAAGAGAYLTVNQRNFRDKPGPGDGGISGIVSISASYRLSDRWLTRVTWNRVVTRYDRDTDVIQAGIGYRF
ncbi:hypothetical protein LIG30_2970 [Burkholderia sp. lig30]|jgi:hypothetical protein|uniref:hypothetical protein n=1 Tax=Burkholderia sp. lig30 TaxID=1192124 RepID=UPI000460E05E|nr:hypothetical protein [Burkholderia sp. lig30]KDB07989.1 hypothetical protein LIG30_2970 [Burkholderia sp. lig30]